jgi:hypothetical protein
VKIPAPRSPRSQRGRFGSTAGPFPAAAMRRRSARRSRCGRGCALAVAAAASLALAAATPVSAAPIVVAQTGGPAPGTGGGVFVVFDPPVLDAAGVATFDADLSGGTAAEGIFAGATQASVVPIALLGQQAPGLPNGVTFGGFDLTLVDEEGHVLVRADLAGPGIGTDNDFGFWSNRAGPLSLVVAEGQDAPGTSGDVFSGLSTAVFSAGRIGFIGDLSGTDVTSENGAGVWLDDGVSQTLLVRLGDSAPGASAPYAIFPAEEGLTLDTTGDLVFQAAVNPADYEYGLWRVPAGGSSAVVAFATDPAPGLDGVALGTIGTPAVNEAGAVAFSTLLTGSGVTLENQASIWSTASGSLALVARAGDVAPGTGGAVFGGIGTPASDASGAVTFPASVTGTGVDAGNENGIWSDRSGSLALVVRGGDAAPGTNGAVFSGFSTLAVNGSGELAFVATLAGAGVDSTNDVGLWRERGGGLSLVVRTGDSLALGQPQVVTQLAFQGSRGNGDGRRSGFDDRGDLAYLTGFASGDWAVLVAPEPGAVALAAAALAALFACRRGLR